MADLDGNGLPDLLFPKNSSCLVVLFNKGDLAFKSVELPSMIAKCDKKYLSRFAFQAADFDGDRDLDLLFISSGQISLSYNQDGLGNFTDPTVVRRDIPLAHSVDAIDLDADGNLDIFWCVSLACHSPLYGINLTAPDTNIGPRRAVSSMSFPAKSTPFPATSGGLATALTVRLLT